MALLKSWTHAALDNIDHTDRITFPAGIAEGDLIVIGAIHTKSPRLPAGYVAVHTSTTIYGRSLVGWKVASGTDAATADYQFVTLTPYNPLVPATIVTGGGGYFVMVFAAGTFDPANPILHIDASNTEPGIGGWEVPAYEESYFWTFLDYRRYNPTPDVYSEPTVPFIYPSGYVLDSIVTAGRSLFGPSSDPYQPDVTVDPDSQGILAVATSDIVTGHFMSSVASTGEAHVAAFRMGFSVRSAPGVTTWGPLSGEAPITPVPFLYPDAASITANVGMQDVLLPTSTTDAMSNVGAEVTLEDTTVGTTTANVGATIAPEAQSTAYAYSSEVDDSPPIPHIWTTHRQGGLVGDVVTIYGHGFYRSYLEDPGFEKIPQFGYGKYYEIGYGRGLGSTPGVRHLLGTGGELVSPEEDIETFGDPQAIHIANGVAPQIINLEYTKLEVTIPEEAAVGEGAGPGPFIDYFVIVNPNDLDLNVVESNKAEFRLYPLIPTTMANSPTANRGATMVRVIGEPADTTRIDQTHDKILLSGRMVSNGYAEALPMFAAFSTSGADMGDLTALSNARGPRDNDFDLGGDGGVWYPSEDTLIPRPDLGTGVILWEPWLGTTDQRWRMVTPRAPYLDPAFQTEPGDFNRDPIIRPALVFTGDQLLELETPFDLWDVGYNQQFTLLLVVSMNARGGTIMQTESIGPSSGQPEVRIVDDGTYSVLFPDYSVAANGNGGAEGDIQVLGLTVSGNRVHYCWGGYSLDNRTFFNPEAGLPEETLSLTIGGPVAGTPAAEMTRMNLFQIDFRRLMVSDAQLREMVQSAYAQYRRVYF